MAAGRIKGIIRATLDGEKFDSRREMRRWAQLQLMLKSKPPLISDLRRQVKFALMGRDGPLLTPTGRQMHYIADFVYRDSATGQDVVEDAKGWSPPEYLVKKAVLAAQGVQIIEV